MKRALLMIDIQNDYFDGGADVYHQPGYPLATQGSLLNEVTFTVSPLEEAKFVVNDSLLAPTGTLAKEPKSFPVYSFHLCLIKFLLLQKD